MGPFKSYLTKIYLCKLFFFSKKIIVLQFLLKAFKF